MVKYGRKFKIPNEAANGLQLEQRHRSGPVLYSNDTGPIRLLYMRVDHGAC